MSTSADVRSIAPTLSLALRATLVRQVSLDKDKYLAAVRGFSLNSAIPNYLFYRVATRVGMAHLMECLGLWYRVYCLLPKDCSMVTFGKVLRQECSVKHSAVVNGCLMEVDIHHEPS